MVMVNSYRFLARAGIALLLLAAVAAVGVGVSNLHLPGRRATHLVAAHQQRWQLRQLVVDRAGRSGSSATLRVLVVGASVSHGLGASSPSHDYVSDLGRMLEARTGRTVDLTVWSRPGARIAVSDSWTLPAGEQVVVVQLITNDFIDATPLLSYQQDLTTLLDRLHATSPRASLLCVGAWEPSYAVNRVGLPVLAYDSIEKSACNGHGGHFLSPSPIFQHSAWRGPAGRLTAFGKGDDFHPNNKGHLHLADAILAQLEAQHAVPPAAPAHPSTLVKGTSARRAHD